MSARPIDAPARTVVIEAIAPAVDGGRYPNVMNFVTTDNTYWNTLPSAEIAYNVTDNTVVRAAASKTITRPDPNAMLPGVNFIVQAEQIVVSASATIDLTNGGSPAGNLSLTGPVASDFGSQRRGEQSSRHGRIRSRGRGARRLA